MGIKILTIKDFGSCSARIAKREESVGEDMNLSSSGTQIQQQEGDLTFHTLCLYYDR